MRRTAALLLTCMLVLVGIPACGDGPVPTLLEVDPPTQETRFQGPVLRGRATGGAPTRRATGAALLKATVDAQARISIPDDALWGTLKQALLASARVRRDRESLRDRTPMLVSLPGLEGYVIVGGEPPKGVGLALSLAGAEQNPATEVRAHGTSWTAKNGCDGKRHWQAKGWSMALWQDALQRLKALGRATEHGLHVRADDTVPAAVVLRFLATAVDAGLGAAWVGTEGGDAVASNDTLPWLAAHQLPSGAWSDELASAYCAGLRMEHVALPDDANLDGDPALTGLVLCGYLGAGYTHRGKHPFAKVISRGMRYLKSQQGSGGVFRSNSAWTEAAGHGWAALAMIEVFGMTGSLIYKGSAQRALEALEPTWRRSGHDPLATVLTAMCLRSAQLINQDAKRRGRPALLTLHATLEKALVADARTLSEEKLGFHSAAGMLTRILFGEDPKKHSDIGTRVVPLIDSLATAGGEADPGLVWLTTHVTWQVGGAQAWKPMRTLLHKAKLGSQRSEGHVCCLRGSWDPRPHPSMPGGRVAATALMELAHLHLYSCYSCMLGR